MPNGLVQIRVPFVRTQSKEIQLFADIPRRTKPNSLPRQAHAAKLTQPNPTRRPEIAGLLADGRDAVDANVAPGFSPALFASDPRRRDKFQPNQILILQPIRFV